MSFNAPRTLAELESAAARHGAFTAQGLSGDYIAVLTYSHGFRHFSGPLADMVHRSAKDLNDRYVGITARIVESDHRALYADEVIYFVTENATGYVIAVATADNRVIVSPRAGVSFSRYGAAISGLARFPGAIWENVYPRAEIEVGE